MDVIHFENHPPRPPQRVTEAPPAAVVTIGNFDGVHLGHQALISKVVAEASQIGVRSALLTFHPHPQTIVRGDAPPMLTTSPMRLRLFESLGLDAAYFIPFTREFSQTTPEAFVKSYLFSTFEIRKLVIGYDFHFGQDRAGSAVVLERLSREEGFEFEVFPEVSLGGRKVSSSAIRAALAGLDFSTATALLGRPFSVLEGVVRGDQRGRTLGFPTLNQPVEDALPIPFGVYASRAVLGERTFEAISNYGIQPTVGGGKRVLETHLFGFEGDLYGELAEVIPLHKLRDEKKFPSLEALGSQIAADCVQALAYHRRSDATPTG